MLRRDDGRVLRRALEFEAGVKRRPKSCIVWASLSKGQAHVGFEQLNSVHLLWAKRSSKATEECVLRREGGRTAVS